jgi:hypothetical protein
LTPFEESACRAISILVSFVGFSIRRATINEVRWQLKKHTPGTQPRKQNPEIYV